MCTYCVLKVKVWQCLWLWTEVIKAERWTHLAAQSGELAEGDDQIVKHIIEAVVSCNHRTFPAKHRRLHTLTADKHKLFTLHSLFQLNNCTPVLLTPVLKCVFFVVWNRGQSLSYSNHMICPSTVNTSNLCVGGPCFSYRLTCGCGHLKAISSQQPVLQRTASPSFYHWLHLSVVYLKPVMAFWMMTSSRLLSKT